MFHFAQILCPVAPFFAFESQKIGDISKKMNFFFNLFAAVFFHFFLKSSAFLPVGAILRIS